MVKKGDTLIEVTLAVGIFSMIAIAIVAVMSNGTVGAQTALETTLTREEIDAQAEALRFIHASYISDKDSNNENLAYVQLWKQITSKAKVFTSSDSSDEIDKIIKFTPNKGNGGCPVLYGNNNANLDSGAFVINTRALGNLPSGAVKKSDGLIETVLISSENEDGSKSNKFSPAQTYPHLIYGSTAKNNEDKKSKIGLGATTTNLYRAEGIYIIVVKDSGSTQLSEGNNTINREASAFFDFYIRTCWYGANAEEPSTISTVIRLYDPDAVKTPEIVEPEAHIKDKDAPIATIDGRPFTKTNEGSAFVGYACHTYPDDGSEYANKSYVGPVLVSKDQNAVAYTTPFGTFASDYSINFRDSTYFIGTYVNWMRVDSCDNASSVISDAVGKTNKIYTWPEQTLTGEEAVKSAANQLLKDLYR